MLHNKRPVQLVGLTRRSPWLGMDQAHQWGLLALVRGLLVLREAEAEAQAGGKRVATMVLLLSHPAMALAADQGRVVVCLAPKVAVAGMGVGMVAVPADGRAQVGAALVEQEVKGALALRPVVEVVVLVVVALVLLLDLVLGLVVALVLVLVLELELVQV